MEILRPGDNPYLDQYLELSGSPWERYAARGALVKKYSWAIPDDTAIRILTRYPITEIGAGKGYWASLVNKAGGDIQAYDRSYGLGKENRYTDNLKPWYPVNLIKEKNLIKVVQEAAIAGRTLFLCWPEYNEPWVHQYLETYIKHKGPRLVYVGEGHGGCCADDAFHELLYNYPVVESHYIPRWVGINDYLQVVEF